MSQRAPLTLDHQETQSAVGSQTIFGFWVYLMTDCVLFASLFATFVVLRNNVYDGPQGAQIFSLPFVLTETIILLTSSFSAGLAILVARRGERQQALAWLGLTFVLGAAFLTLEIREFAHLVNEGNSWRRSGFLSAFFTLVSTHGAHITSGLVWMGVVWANIYRRGINPINIRRLTILSLFWHFLDIVWIFIFTIVYLMGAIA
jgi:cytochrome o ubiquinol oxidase subunit 3